MDNVITIRYYNTEQPDLNVALVRDLVPSLQNFQRALDKLAIYAENGRILKSSKLSYRKQGLTDLYISAFENGSFKVPLLGNVAPGLRASLRGFLQGPYERAAQEFDEELDLPIRQRMRNIIARDEEGGIDYQYEAELAEGSPDFNRRDAQGKFLRDMDKSIFAMTKEEGQGVEIKLYDQEHTSTYDFDRRTARRFHSLVDRPSIEEPILCHGTIHSLGRKSLRGTYRFHAKYVSNATGEERNIYILDEVGMMNLRPYNLGAEFSFIACPVARYGAHDTMRGDLIFVRLVT